jgi:hypothetical protein
LSIEVPRVNDLDGDGQIHMLVVAFPDHAVGPVTDGMLEAITADDVVGFDVDFHTITFERAYIV